MLLFRKFLPRNTSRFFVHLVSTSMMAIAGGLRYSTLLPVPTQHPHNLPQFWVEEPSSRYRRGHRGIVVVLRLGQLMPVVGLLHGGRRESVGREEVVMNGAMTHSHGVRVG